MKLLAIYDTDLSYAARLMDYMKGAGLAGFEILLFSRKDSLEGFLKDHVIELLLLGEGVEEEPPRENIRFILRLSGEKTACCKEELQAVYKYQAARNVVNDLLAAYMKAQGYKEQGRMGDMEIISVFAPAGGPGVASYTWLLAHCLADRKKVLHLSLEQLPIPPVSVLGEEDQALSDFIYYLKEGHDRLIPKLKSLLKYAGKLACLAGLAHGLDLLSPGREDAVRLIEELRTNTDYEAVIFYHGIYTEFTIELMKQSSCCHILYHGTGSSKAALKEWDRQMKLLKVDTAIEPFKKLLLPEGICEEISADKPEELKNSALWQLARQEADLL